MSGGYRNGLLAYREELPRGERWMSGGYRARLDSRLFARP